MINRRTALKHLALSTAGLLSLPAWATGWSAGSLVNNSTFLSPAQQALLADVVETIIPTTDTPGARELGVHQFVQRMVEDCYEPAARETLIKGLAALDAVAKQQIGKPFAVGNQSQREGWLQPPTQPADPNRQAFLELVKGLTIQGYLTSEYVMTNLTHYEFIPGRYLGCVPVTSTPTK